MRQNSFNIVNVAVAVLAIMVIIAILLPAIAPRHRPARRMQNSTQLRGIHQGLVTYANSNKEFFPGLNEFGEDDKITVEERFQILIEDDYFTPEYAISPSETEPMWEWDSWNDENENPVTTEHYSYAMLQVPKDGGRRHEWSQTLNTFAIVLSDRNTGTSSKPSSIHVEPGDSWAGSVLWNDNHVAFEQADDFETLYGEYDLGKDTPTPGDRLFESPGTDDALLIHSGNEKE